MFPKRKRTGLILNSRYFSSNDHASIKSESELKFPTNVDSSAIKFWSKENRANNTFDSSCLLAEPNLLSPSHFVNSSPKDCAKGGRDHALSSYCRLEVERSALSRASPPRDCTHLHSDDKENDNRPHKKLKTAARTTAGMLNMDVMDRYSENQGNRASPLLSGVSPPLFEIEDMGRRNHVRKISVSTVISPRMEKPFTSPPGLGFEFELYNSNFLLRQANQWESTERESPRHEEWALLRPPLESTTSSLLVNQEVPLEETKLQVLENLKSKASVPSSTKHQQTNHSPPSTMVQQGDPPTMIQQGEHVEFSTCEAGRFLLKDDINPTRIAAQECQVNVESEVMVEQGLPEVQAALSTVTTTAPVPLNIRYLGYTYDLKPFQERVVRATMEGRDTFVLMATGGGKSMCYQIPPLLGNFICLVISPLISLMQNQVFHLVQRGIKACYLGSHNDRAELQKIQDGYYSLIYLTAEKLQLWLPKLPTIKRRIGLVAVDEAHCISEWGHDFRPEFRSIHLIRETLPNVPIMCLTATATGRVQRDIMASLLHNPVCEQGTFDRPNLFIQVRQKHFSKQKKWMSDAERTRIMTADVSIIYDAILSVCAPNETTDAVTNAISTSNDIQRFQKHKKKIKTKGKKNSIPLPGQMSLLKSFAAASSKSPSFSGSVSSFSSSGSSSSSSGSAASSLKTESSSCFSCSVSTSSSSLPSYPFSVNIIYCNTQKDTEALTEILNEHHAFRCSNSKTTLSPTEPPTTNVKMGLGQKHQSDEKSPFATAYHAGLSAAKREEIHDLFIGNHLRVLVATTAFGMGIDKPNIRQVFHYGAPKSLETYYQQIGRAGRDGLPSQCLLFWNNNDFQVHEFLMSKNAETFNTNLELLNSMRNYVKNTRECRREQLLAYFNEDPPLESNPRCCDNCGFCDSIAIYK